MYKINACGAQKATTMATYQEHQGKQGAGLHLETLNTVIKAGAEAGWSRCAAV